MKSTIVSTLICFNTLFISHPVLHAQEDPWTIVTTSGDTLQSCGFDHMDGDRVQLVCVNLARHIAADSVARLSRDGGSHFLLGATIGTFAGAMIGGVIGAASYDRPKSTGFTIDFGPGFDTMAGVLVGAVGGFAVGGIIGAATRTTEEYDLTAETHAGRVRILTQLAARKN